MISKGHEVKLYCRNQSIHKFDKAFERGGFDFINEGEKTFVKFTDISDDMSYVLKDAEVIQMIIPSSFIEHYAKTMAPLINNDQLILFNIAAAMGSIRFINVLEKKHIETMPNYLTESFRTIKELYPYIVKEESLWKTNLENGNPEVHPGPTLLNVGRIDYADEFALYKEGITPHTVKLLHAVELERLSLGRKLGFELNTAKGARIERGYLSNDDEDEPLNKLFNTSPVFSQINGPNEVENRYLTEDIAYGLVLWSSLGKVIGVPTPNIDAIIVIASTILERDFYTEGLTVESLGLEKLGLE
uniref:Opine dehydrogenase domain-containing protein n=1 Tax=Acyrthosiphon pisum TaxID=7029 RepID=A0A8R2HC41_ACYPI|eukprot:XP_016664625.1 PREDICTED: opine dehydrogenase-like [Acyrthosiphon pisum]